MIMFNVEEQLEKSSDGDWYLVGFYGPPYAAKKKGFGEFVCFTGINSKALDLLWRLQHCLG